MNIIELLLSKTEDKQAIGRMCQEYIKLKTKAVDYKFLLLNKPTNEEYIKIADDIAKTEEKIDRLTAEFNYLLGEELTEQELISEINDYSRIVIEKIMKNYAK